MITQKELKEVLAYDSITGTFISIEPNSGTCRAWADRLVGTTSLSTEIAGESYLVADLAFLYEYGSLPNGAVRHIDGNKFNNSINNLKVGM